MKTTDPGDSSRSPKDASVPARSARYSPLRALVSTRVKEFFREPAAIFWVYGFPIILATGLGLAFRAKPPPDFRVALVTAAPSESAPEETRGPATSTVERSLVALAAAEGLTVELVDEVSARKSLSRGRLDLVVRVGPTTLEYVFDAAKDESWLARHLVDGVLQRAAGRQDSLETSNTIVSEPGSRYIDFLFPGLMGMNLVGGGIFGVGFVIVDMRVRKLLKRFLATPMRKRDFLVATLASRVFFIIPEMFFLFGVATLVFGMPFNGNFLDLAVVVLVGSLCFAGIGLLVSSRASKIETVSGLINLIMLPMWLLSGVFFSTERFPDAMQPIIQLLPLTAANDALRAVILDGAGLASQVDEFAILGTWAVVSFAISLKVFRWT